MMLQDRVGVSEPSAAGGSPPVTYGSDVLSYLNRSHSAACRVQEAFKSSSCTSDGDGRSFVYSGGKGVGKGFVKKREQTIEALQQFDLSQLRSILSLSRLKQQPGTDSSLLALPTRHV